VRALRGHDLGRSHLAVQAELVNDEHHLRGFVPDEDALLPVHAASQPDAGDLLGGVGGGFEDRLRVGLGLQQAVKDSRHPRAQADGLVLVLWPAAESGRRPLAAVQVRTAGGRATAGASGAAGAG
jgi:hypothetical protein